jgi:hypothetical protein
MDTLGKTKRKGIKRDNLGAGLAPPWGGWGGKNTGNGEKRGWWLKIGGWRVKSFEVKVKRL